MSHLLVSSEARDTALLIKVLIFWRGWDARAPKYKVTNYRIPVRRLRKRGKKAVSQQRSKGIPQSTPWNYFSIFSEKAQISRKVLIVINRHMIEWIYIHVININFK